jgi:beta-galactosidase
MTKYLKISSILLFFTLNTVSAQIKITSLPQNQNGIFDPVFYDKNEYRNVDLLLYDWNVYPENDNEKQISTSVPAYFEGKESIVFEKRISFTSQQIQNSQFILGFLGLNYYAEIFVNDYNIFKHQGGSYPFEIALPKDILKENSIIKIKVSNKLDSESTIPVLQSFLFPNLEGGIFREVYLKSVPSLHITYSSYSLTFDQNFAKASINFHVGIGNSLFQKSSQLLQSKDVLLRVTLTANGSTSPQAKSDFVQTITAEDNDVTCRLDITNPALWSPAKPNYYLCELSILRDGQVVDKTVKQIAFFAFDKNRDRFLLNGTPFSLQGTTYYLDETSLHRMVSYQRIKDDLTLIKNTGFNAVRFAKSFPNPYSLKLCQELGLIALIELPLNSVPEEIFEKNEFQLRTFNFLKTYVNCYLEYGNTLMIGVGSSFLANSTATENFISKLCQTLKDKKILSYASFVGAQTAEIPDLDFYGIELYTTPVDASKEHLQKIIKDLGKSSVFISELTYPNYVGDQNGYLTKNSSDSQAKYFADMITLARDLNISGFFINSLFNYNGAFSSLFGSYTNNKIYKFGILDFSRDLNSIGYKVLYSKLNDGTKVTIPIGSKKEDNPIIFIFIALFLSLIMAALINLKKKFREDCSRALFRPYNFFSDIRDRRIISGLHTAVLMMVQAGSVSLLFTILFYFLRTNIFMEKIVLAFGSHTLMKWISFISWNPMICFVILFFIIILKFILISFIVLTASVFIKTRVEFMGVLYSVIWSFLPFTLLLPVELLLFKILVNGSFTIIILAVILFFGLWVLQRMLKGIYVIFDVRPLTVYFYSILFIILIACGVILKYQYTNSTIYYIENAIKQYKMMIF